LQSIGTTPFFEDGTDDRGKTISDWCNLVHEASRRFGKDMKTVPSWKGWQERAGFKNVTEETYKLPLSPWTEDSKLNQLGLYHQVNLLEALESYTYALFTRFLGWTRDEIEQLLENLRRELTDLSVHAYTKVYIVYGQKEGEEK